SGVATRRVLQVRPSRRSGGRVHRGRTCRQTSCPNTFRGPAHEPAASPAHQGARMKPLAWWTPMDWHGWEAIASVIPKPWPREAAAFDLRQMADDEAIRGRPALGVRWGWSDWSVRSLLRDESAWRNPLQLPS